MTEMEREKSYRESLFMEPVNVDCVIRYCYK